MLWVLLKILGIAAVVAVFSAEAQATSACHELFQVIQARAAIVDNRTVYFEHFPAAPKKPTAIVFLGLFTPMSNLAAFQKEFVRLSHGEGLIVFTYSTQVESMLWRHYSQSGRAANAHDVELNDFVRQATGVINIARVQEPVVAVGYSYGSAPAARFAEFHRDRVSGLVFVTPLMTAGDQSYELLRAKRALEDLALLNPFWGPQMLEHSREQAADKMAISIVDGYLSHGTFPAKLTRAEVVTAVKAQIRAVETFSLIDEPIASWPETQLILAENEAESRFTLQQELVKWPSMRATVVPGGEHSLMSDKPKEVANQILRFMRVNKANR